MIHFFLFFGGAFHLTGPAIRTPVMHVKRPTEATAIWWLLPDSQISLAFSTASPGRRPTRSLHICPLLLLSLTLASVPFWRVCLRGVTPPLGMWELSEGEDKSPDPYTARATRKAQVRKAMVLSITSQAGVETVKELCTKETRSSWAGMYMVEMFNPQAGETKQAFSHITGCHIHWVIGPYAN